MKRIPLLLMLLAAPVAWSQPLPLRNADFTQVGADGRPADWTLTTWYGCPVPTLSAGQDPPHARLDFPVDAPVYTISLHQTLPDLPVGATARVGFRYRATFAGARQFSVAISGGPGCNLPCNRVWLALTADGQWHDAEVSMPLRRVKPVGSVLEFVGNGPFSKGDQLALAAVRLETDPPPVLTLGFTNPASGVLFTDSPRQVLQGVLTLGPQATGRRARVELFREGAEQPLQVAECAAGQPKWSFDLTRAPLGRYRVVAALSDDTGKIVGQQELRACRTTPTADTTRVVNGVVHVGSKPVVLFGTYHVCDFAVEAVNRENKRLGLPPLDRDAMLAGLAKSGLDSAFYSWGIPSQEYLQAAARQRHRVIPECAGLGREWGGEPLEKQVTPFADDPRVFAWGGSDEPSETTLDRAVEVYRGLKSASPRKLVVNSFCQPDVVDLLNGQALPADLVLLDIYDVRKPEADLSRTGQAVAHVVQYARKYGGMAVGVAPQAFIYNGPEPTPEQLRAQIYLGLVNGATAFFPYAYVEDYGDRPFAGHDGNSDGMSGNPARQRWWLPDSAMWAMMPRLRRELDALTPVILRGQPLAVTMDPSPVQFRAARADGQAYLIAVNPQAQTNAALFRFPTPLQRLSPLHGTPAASAQGQTLPLTFGAYEVKVLRLALAQR